MLAVQGFVIAFPTFAVARSGDTPANPVLTAVVGTNDGTNISLNDASGAPVRHLDVGTYRIVVDDSSAFHNFHLFGPGVGQTTSVIATGETVWTVSLRDGYYQFQCDPHKSFMHGDFTVGTGTRPPRALTAAVGPGKRISLVTASGRRVTTIDAGRYVITVHDGLATDNFHLIGPGVNKMTGIRFRGTVRWSVTFSPGRYIYRCDRHSLMRGKFTAAASGSSG